MSTKPTRTHADLNRRNDARIISIGFFKRRLKKIIFSIFVTILFLFICYRLPKPLKSHENQELIVFDIRLRDSNPALVPVSPFDVKVDSINIQKSIGGNENHVELNILSHSTQSDSLETKAALAALLQRIEFIQHEKRDQVPAKTENESENDSILISVISTQAPGQKAAPMACKLPNLKPFSPAVRPFIGPPEEVICENEYFPLLFKMEGDTLVRLANDAWNHLERCCMSNISRFPGEDDMIDVEETCKNIRGKRTLIPESIETFLVSCFDGKQKKWNDMDIFSIPRLKPEVEERIALSQMGPEAMNVVILGLDAISHMNFQRTMQRTHKFLKQNLSAFYFDGYTKVGDNTFPNLMPFLTGMSQQEVLESCWSNQDDHLDDCPYIWKNFSRKGYRTSFGEDLPQISTFNYMRKGFQDPPTDFYQRPMFIAQDLYIGHTDLLNGNVCYGPRLTFDVAFDYLQRLASLMGRDKRYFHFAWVNSLFHDFLSTPALADQSLLFLLIWFQKQGYLENTTFILMSDHGIRWGSIRETLQGKIEERMPFFYIVLPSKIKSQYPEAIKNMKINQNRLTTHFDAHETLLDLLYPEKLSSEELLKREKSWNVTLPRGISLFLPIPTKRTCKDAGVDDHWCVCSTMVPVDVATNTDVHDGAKAMLQSIHSKLSRWRQCAKLKIHEIIRAQLKVTNNDLIPESAVGDDEDEISTFRPIVNSTLLQDQQYEITIKTSPGAGVFEASVTKFINGTFKVGGAISRINLYGKQSHCVKNSTIKLLCYCTDLLGRTTPKYNKT